MEEDDAPKERREPPYYLTIPALQSVHRRLYDKTPAANVLTR